jgi:hypothetical protein
MKFVTVLFISLLIFVPASMAQGKKKAGSAARTAAQKDLSTQETLQIRMKEFLTARQTRNGVAARRYFHPNTIKELHENVKILYASTKDGIDTGQFTREYVEKSVTDGDMAEPYKHAILRYLLKNADFDRELDAAFTRYMATYPYKIVSFQIDKVSMLPDGKTGEVSVTENRQSPGQKGSQPVLVAYKWKLIENNWYLMTDKPVHF